MKKFYIYYNNGHIESRDKIDFNFLHLIDIGVVRLIIDTGKNTVWIRNDEGIAKEIEIPEIKT